MDGIISALPLAAITTGNGLSNHVEMRNLLKVTLPLIFVSLSTSNKISSHSRILPESIFTAQNSSLERISILNIILIEAIYANRGVYLYVCLVYGDFP